MPAAESRHDKTSVGLISHIGKRRAADFEGTRQVYLINQIPAFITHLMKRLVTQNPGIVDRDVNPAKVIHGTLNNLLAIGDRVRIGDRIIICCLDFRNKAISNGRVTAFSGPGAAQIIDNNSSTQRAEQ